MKNLSIIRKCPECKKLFALSKGQTTEIAREDTRVVESLTQPHLKGELHQMATYHVAGERITYATEYVCRYCGKTQIVETSKVNKK